MDIFLSTEACFDKNKTLFTNYRRHRKVDIDECQNHKCQNGATCSDRVAGYTCHCSAGYNGT
uniref:EGF-like domain-containing protein n=1 Tax=Romanomermis culicivorax TaxID=13658 RepID=A0A915J8A6_ROMCU